MRGNFLITTNRSKNNPKIRRKDNTTKSREKEENRKRAQFSFGEKTYGSRIGETRRGKTATSPLFICNDSMLGWTRVTTGQNGEKGHLWEIGDRAVSIWDKGAPYSRNPQGVGFNRERGKGVQEEEATERESKNTLRT